MSRLKYFSTETNQWEYADNVTGNNIDLTNYATKEYVENSKVAIDTTLKIEGQAADAKAVGEALADIDNLQTNLDSKADKSQGIFYIEGDSSSTTDTTNKVATWIGSHDEITEYFSGLTILYKVITAGSTTTTLNINSLGAVTVVRNATTGISTSCPVNGVLLLTYTIDSDGTAYWKTADYDANTKNTAGTSNKVDTKLFLVGGASQSSSGVTTYTNKNIYINTSNVLYSANGFSGKLAGNADTATKATQDASGNVITTTYATKNDVAAEISQLSSEKANKSGLTLGVHTDGLVYIFIDGQPQGNGLDIKAGVIEGDVFGYVDEKNTIVLNGALAEGTYIIKYEMEDGSTVEIGDLVLDNNVYYSVTNTLTNCINSNSAVEVVQGESYSATITAESGYELSSVVVTMGGNAVTVTDGIINIDNVTGDIVITAVAEKNTAAEPINFCVINTTVPSNANYYADTDPTSPSYGWISGGRSSGEGANRTDSSTTCLTNYIPVQNGDVVYVKGLDMSTTARSGIYKSDYTAIKGVTMTAADAAGYLSGIDLSGEWEQFTIDNADVGFVRLCGTPSGMNTGGAASFFDRIDITSVNIVVNIKRNGEWLRDTQATEPKNFAEPNTTNKTDISIWCNDARFGSGGTYRESSGTVVTNFIPFTGDILYIDGMNISLTSDALTNSISFWDENKGFLIFGSVLNFTGDNNYGLVVTQDADGVYAFDFSNFSLEPADITTPYAYIRLCGTLTGTVDDVVINVKRNGEWLRDTQATEPVTTAINITKDYSIELSAGALRGSESVGYCTTDFVELTDIPKPCTINLTGARWTFTNASDSGYIRFFAADTSGTILVGEYTHPSKMPDGVSMVLNNAKENDITVTVTSNNIGKIRFCGCYGTNPGGTGLFEDVKATLTYTPVS